MHQDTTNPLNSVRQFSERLRRIAQENPKSEQYTSNTDGKTYHINYTNTLGSGVFSDVSMVSSNGYTNAQRFVSKQLICDNYTTLYSAYQELSVLDSLGRLEGYTRNGYNISAIMPYIDGETLNVYLDRFQYSKFANELSSRQAEIQDFFFCNGLLSTDHLQNTGNTFIKDGKTIPIDFGLTVNSYSILSRAGLFFLKLLYAVNVAMCIIYPQYHLLKLFLLLLFLEAVMQTARINTFITIPFQYSAGCSSALASIVKVLFYMALICLSLYTFVNYLLPTVLQTLTFLAEQELGYSLFALALRPDFIPQSIILIQSLTFLLNIAAYVVDMFWMLFIPKCVWIAMIDIRFDYMKRPSQFFKRQINRIPNVFSTSTHHEKSDFTAGATA